MSVYIGDIQIEDADFDLKANQFIIRENEYSISFSGSDEFGKFNIEGIAVKSEAGFYIAPRLELIYSDYSGTDTASIRFDVIELSKEKNNCSIKGAWIQDGDNWNFSAKLKKLQT